MKKIQVPTLVPSPEGRGLGRGGGGIFQMNGTILPPLPGPPPRGEGKQNCRFGVWIFFGACCLLLVACTPVSSNLRTITLKSPVGQTVSFQVEVADTPSERAIGLMFRENLRDGEGMLFVFEEERPLSFWMKNTLIPLDILFFDADGKFVSGVSMEPCQKDPCRSYVSAGPAQFGLEVSAGFLKKYPMNSDWALGGAPNRRPHVSR